MSVLRYKQLIESSHAFGELCDDCRRGLCKHAYIFRSSDTDALSTLAAMFICFAEHGEMKEFELGRIADGGYVDIVRLPREGKNGKMDVEEASYITDSAYLTPTELSTKYYIISPTEPISEAVQNKLLKTLEEPPESARFIIFSAGADLLPTVSSRCSTVRLEEFPLDKIEQTLVESGVDYVSAVFATAVSHGNIGTAFTVASDPSNRKAYECAMNFLLGVKRSPQILPSASGMIALKDKLGTVLDYFEIIFRDIAAFNEWGADAVVLKPSVSDIITLSREFDTRTCLRIMPLITRARDRLRLYGNAASITDELLFSILEVKAKCRK